MTQATVDPKTTFVIERSPKFASVLSAVNATMKEPGRRRNILFVVRAVLEMLDNGVTTFTVDDVVRSIHENDTPKGGWINWDWNKWYPYVPRVVKALQSDNPMSALQL